MNDTKWLDRNRSLKLERSMTTTSIWSGTVSFDHTHSGHAQPWPLVIHSIADKIWMYIVHALMNTIGTNLLKLLCHLLRNRWFSKLFWMPSASNMNCTKHELHHMRKHIDRTFKCVSNQSNSKGGGFSSKTHTLPKLVYNFNFEWTIVWLRFDSKIYIHTYLCICIWKKGHSIMMDTVFVCVYDTSHFYVDLFCFFSYYFKAGLGKIIQD